LSQSFRIYTTLDPALQRAAAAAVDIGMKNVDKLLAPRYAVWKRELAKKHSSDPVPHPQVAMVVLDPKTGEIKALVGGRDYGQSQLNHALARRQPGSAFKPFVYAAAFDDAVEGTGPIVTTATTVVDEPTTFEFDGKEYTPDNFGQEFRGTVTLRDALTHSLNVATVKVAELVGYGHVVDMARKMGLQDSIQPTPAVALGAYEMTPLEVAAGYTAFAESGVRAEPMFLQSVISADGKVVEHNDPHTRPVLDPRVAYLVTNVLEDVVNHGTAYPVRQWGFTAPAAGKTGTSRDGWFAGYTSNLLCVVWVGFDDNRDLGLAGGVTAAPIWAEFMKRAVSLPAYQNTQEFVAPAGIVRVTIDPDTLELATPNCPVTREEVFIAGTEPTQFCERHGGGAGGESFGSGWLSKIFGGKQPEPPPPPAPSGNAPGSPAGVSPAPKPITPGAATGAPAAGQAAPAADTDKKKGLLHKIFSIFGGKDDNSGKDEK
ncbi:MAG: penicillin-binding transpeptidase domain-containing protein, partial [Bryobacteraceae bacterium]